ncbi:MAG: XkdX family protein [Staphylococcus saprophyticus]
MYPSFDSIKWFYEINVYSNQDIKTYVELNVLSKFQYESITGEEYPEQPQA